jgi:uncharacterized membrane protein
MAKATRNQPVGPTAKNARSQPLPDNLDTLKEKLGEAISSVIGQGQSAQIVELVTQVVAEETFTGPVPHPRHLAEYEKICPGLADRMMAMAEKAQEKQEERKSRELELAYTERKIGLILGLLALGIIVVGGVITSIFGSKIIGGGLLTAAIFGAAITPFIHGRSKSSTGKS